MSPEEDWARECERARRWESAGQRFGIICATLLGLGWLAFKLYREWVIWTR